MAELIPTWPFVVMSEENVVVQVLQTVPAKRVLAVLAHHLGAALVALDVHQADRALLNGRVRGGPEEGPVLCW